MSNKPNYRSEVLGNVLHITVPSPKMWFNIIYLSVWLTIWSFGAFILREIGRGEANFGLFLFSIIWMLGEIEGIYHLLWQLFGKEDLELAPDSIAIREEILGFGRLKTYASRDVSRMRVDPFGRVKPYGLASEGISLDKGTGMIAFDYLGKTIRMGIGLNEVQAKELVDKILTQYPQHRSWSIW